MEYFLAILSFLVIILITRNIYLKYKESKKKKIVKEPVSGLNKYGWYCYLKLVFIERVRLKNSILEAILFLTLAFSIILTLSGFITKIETFIYPELPLAKMQTKDGVIKSMKIRRKMADLLVLTTDNGQDIEFAIYTKEREIEILLNQRVKVWYRLDWSSIYSIENYIKEITIDNKSIRLFSFNYEKTLMNDKKYWNFTKYCFYIALFSALILWIQNRKELSIHRLNRMKLYIKNKNKRKVV